MSIRHSGLLVGFTAVSSLALLVLAEPSSAQTARQECSAKYQAAKSAGTLAGETWPQFFSRCMAEAKTQSTAPQPPAPAAAPSAAAPPVAAPPAPAPAPAVTTAPPPPAPAPAVTAAPPPQPPEEPAKHAPAAATAAPPPAENAESAPPVVNPLKPTAPSKPAPAAAQKPPAKTQAAVPPAAPGAAVFPTAIAPAYAKEKKAAARRKTCLDQYNANKATNANGGLKWIQKGGGYFSECNKRLKGES